MRRALLLLCLATGCHSYLIPFDERPLVARHAVDTQGGERLDLDPDGHLVIRPAAGDISAALGVNLYPTKHGLMVTNRLRPATQLEPNDRIVYVAPVLPRNGGLVKKAHGVALANTLSEESLAPHELTKRPLSFGPDTQFGASQVEFDWFDAGSAARKPLERTAPNPTEKTPSPEELRKLPTAHAVRTLDDLKPYLVGLGWLRLDLLVDRNGEEIVVRQVLTEEPRWLPVRLWRPDLTRWHGFDLLRVGSLPAEHRPLKTADADMLVMRVARDSPAGRAGLRPLDVIPLKSLIVLLGGTTASWKAAETHQDSEVDELLGDPLDDDRVSPEDTPVVVRAPNGTFKELVFDLRDDPLELWIPFLFSLQSNGTRMHLGIGPGDALFHYSSEKEYIPTTDSYVKTLRWSAFTTIQGSAEKQESGTVDSGGINFVVDISRLSYFYRWFDISYDKRQQRYGGGR